MVGERQKEREKEYTDEEVRKRMGEISGKEESKKRGEWNYLHLE